VSLVGFKAQNHEQQVLVHGPRSHARPGSNTSTDILCEATDADGGRATPVVSGWLDDPRPDGPRYSAMGNAVTVNVIEWIHGRIVAYEEGRLAA